MNLFQRIAAFCVGAAGLCATATSALADGPSRSYLLDSYVGGRAVADVVPNRTGAVFVGGKVRQQPIGGSARYTYAWPGVYFESRFTGDAVDVKLDDDRNALHLYVDGRMKLTLTKPGRLTVTLRDLGAGTHTVRLEKTSETQNASASFGGFYVASAAEALPAPQYGRRIEFIGDSYTVGYGNSSRGQTCTVEDVDETTDTSRAFGPLTAKHFGAAYRINAYSGEGMVRNYDGGRADENLPSIYPYALFDRTTPAADAGWTPDVIVIGLGTNDFSTPLHPGERWKIREALDADFVSGYVAFVKTLHARWPGAHFILMAATDDSPERIDNTNAAAAKLHADGIGDVEVLPFGGLTYMACHGHPALADDIALSNLLIGRISQLPKFRDAQP